MSMWLDVISIAQKSPPWLSRSARKRPLRVAERQGLAAGDLGTWLCVSTSEPLTPSCSGFLSWCFMIGRTKWRAQTSDQSTARRFNDEAVPLSTCVVLLHAMARDGFLPRPHDLEAKSTIRTIRADALIAFDSAITFDSESRAELSRACTRKSWSAGTSCSAKMS